jgi:hypothetical protein
MRKPPFTSEQELAAAVVEWLRAYQWEVYQEVPVGNGIADIVAKQGPVLWLIETKMSMSIRLLNQLDDRVASAHITSAAVPARKRCEAPWKLLRALGVGLLGVWSDGQIEESVRPRFFRRAKGIELHEQQKTFCAAGSASGGHWTPFKETARNVLLFVLWRPGCTLNELIEGISHHYNDTTAAKRNILMWIKTDVIKGIRIDESVRPYKLYPKKELT